MAERNKKSKKILVYGFYRNRIEVVNSPTNRYYENNYDSSISEHDYFNKCEKLKQIAGDIPIHIVDFIDNNTHWYNLCDDFCHDITSDLYNIILNSDTLDVRQSLNNQTIRGIVPHPVYDHIKI